jgi:hypothetical protein
MKNFKNEKIFVGKNYAGFQISTPYGLLDIDSDGCYHPESGFKIDNYNNRIHDEYHIYQIVAYLIKSVVPEAERLRLMPKPKILNRIYD